MVVGFRHRKLIIFVLQSAKPRSQQDKPKHMELGEGGLKTMTRFEVDHIDALGAIQGHRRIQVFLDHAVEGREAPIGGSKHGRFEKRSLSKTLPWPLQRIVHPRSE